MDIETRHMTWSDVEDLTKIIVDKMRMTGWIPTIVVGLTRGGLNPGMLISHAFDIEMSALDVSLSKKDPIIPPTSTWIPTLVTSSSKSQDAKEHKILVVDDINDTGSTFEWIRKDWMATLRIHLPDWPEEQIKFAALIHNYPSSQPTDYYGSLIDKSQKPEWLIFPWESWYLNNR